MFLKNICPLPFFSYHIAFFLNHSRFDRDMRRWLAQERRAELELLVEDTQVKGNSQCGNDAFKVHMFEY